MRLRKQLAVMLCLLLGFCCISQTVFAYSIVDTGRDCSLSVQFGTDPGLSGAEFSLFRVAEISDTAHFTLTDDFKEYNVSLEDMDAAGWRALAQTLAAYVSKDQLSPLKSEKTDESGNLLFSDLQTGLYLVTGEPYNTGDTLYTPEPLLLCLPDLDESDRWVYDAQAKIKYDERPVAKPIARKVLKVWEDGEDTQHRPKEIQIHLLKNGEVFDTVMLNQANRWSHEWSNLDGKYHWQVTEADVPEGYTVSVSQEGITFVVKNSKETTEEPEKPPTDLPSTGMFWWPVPILACAGIFALSVGLYCRRKQRNTDEK